MVLAIQAVVWTGDDAYLPADRISETAIENIYVR